jgi:hypothetical protein
MRKTFMLFFEAYFYQQNLIFGGGGTGVWTQGSELAIISKILKET